MILFIIKLKVEKAYTYMYIFQKYTMYLKKHYVQLKSYKGQKKCLLILVNLNLMARTVGAAQIYRSEQTLFLTLLT